MGHWKAMPRLNLNQPIPAPKQVSFATHHDEVKFNKKRRPEYIQNRTETQRRTDFRDKAEKAASKRRRLTYARQAHGILTIARIPRNLCLWGRGGFVGTAAELSMMTAF